MPTETFNNQVGHIEGVTEQLANGGGVAKTTAAVYELMQTRLGLVEAGSFTTEEREEEGPHFYDHETGEMFNSKRMYNCGLDKLMEQLPDMLEMSKKFKKPLLVNVATVSDNPGKEAVELVRQVQSSGAHVLYNPDCPSVIGPDGSRMERPSTDLVRFGKIAAALSEANLREPIVIRIAPQPNYARMEAICRLIRNTNIISAVSICNSWQVEDSPIGPAGKSGPAMKKPAALQTSWGVVALRPSFGDRRKIDTISSLGITDEPEMNYRLAIGATLCTVSTLLIESKNRKEDIEKILDDHAKRQRSSDNS